MNDPLKTFGSKVRHAINRAGETLSDAYYSLEINPTKIDNKSNPASAYSQMMRATKAKGAPKGNYRANK